MSIIEKAQLLYWTTRYLQPSQIWHRIHKIGKHRLRHMHRPHALRPEQTQYLAVTPLYIGLADLADRANYHQEHTEALARAANLQVNHFCFLDQPITMVKEIEWNDPAQSQLWRYHLHYFGYVDSLLMQVATGRSDEAYQTFRRLAQSWIQANDVMLGDGWHPYTISLRLVNWLHAAHAFASQLQDDAIFQQQFFGSIVGQAQFLYANLEFDVRGNHLLENLRALIWVGLTFDDEESRKWYQRALHLLEVEVAEQILPDGGHFERTPTYHLVVLKDLLEIALWLQHNGQGRVHWLDDAIRRMCNYLLLIVGSEGKVPLLKDSALDAALPPTDLLAAAALYFDDSRYKLSTELKLYPFLLFGADSQKRFEAMPIGRHQQSSGQSTYLKKSGYAILRDTQQQAYMIIDVGKPCPDYLPAHAHADLLSYELAVAGGKIVVDSGVYEYAAGSWRDYFRSTRAHNTVEIMGQNQSEVWSSFRVARRARPLVHHWQETETYTLLQASHDGYKRLTPSSLHRRTVLWQKNRFWLIVDEVIGEKPATAKNFVHFHPNIELETVNDSCWYITNQAEPLWVAASGHDSYEIICGQTEPNYQGWYSEEFGKRQANQVLALSIDPMQCTSTAYVIAPKCQPSVAVTYTSGVLKAEVTIDNQRFLLDNINSSPQLL